MPKKALTVVHKMKPVLLWKDWRHTMPCSEGFVAALEEMLANPEERGQAVAILADLAKVGLKVAGGVEAKNAGAVPVMQQFNFETKGRVLVTESSSGGPEEDACQAPAPPSRTPSAAPPESHPESQTPSASE